MTNLFELFNMVDESEKEKQEKADIAKRAQEEEKAKQQEEIHKKVAAAKENAISDSKEKAPAPKKETTDAFEPNEDTIIRYMGDSLPIVDFFSPDELAEGLLVTKKDKEPERKPLTGELLRARMEKEFPELVKNLTEIVFLKKKNIAVVVMKAKPKGAGKTDWQNVRPSLYPLPFSLLQDFIALAKVYAVHDLEIHADIYFMTDTNEYVLDIPAQRVHKYQVEVTETNFELASRLSSAMKMLEIHSHHTMAPFPSNLDNQSERFPGMYYAIVGKTNQFFPDITVRRFENEKVGFTKLSLNEVFEEPFTEIPYFNAEKVEVLV